MSVIDVVFLLHPSLPMSLFQIKVSCSPLLTAIFMLFQQSPIWSLLAPHFLEGWREMHPTIPFLAASEVPDEKTGRLNAVVASAQRSWSRSWDIYIYMYIPTYKKYIYIRNQVFLELVHSTDQFITKPNRANKGVQMLWLWFFYLSLCEIVLKCQLNCFVLHLI